MTLVDTSAWLAHFRAGGGVDLERVVSLDEAVTCLPVVQEVLQGVSDDRSYRRLREAMHALPMVESPLGEGVFGEAVDLYRAARRRGLTVRSSVDCLIAACALRHDLVVLHDDRDYDQLARVSALRVRALRSR